MNTTLHSKEMILTVSQLTQAIKGCLEPRFKELVVQGEISNFKAQSSGHLYFSLKDENSQISAVLFKGNALRLSRIPKGGDKVVVKGEISVYAPRGSYQIIVRELSFLGLGELLLKLHAMKEMLKGRGWFDLERKKKLPKLPKVIGVVTSPTGAVIQDIINVLSRRFKGIHLILNPVKVQGEGAAEEIAKAIYDFNAHNLADILIVGRGGGSLEDLWAFNEEVVAKAIFESKIPIISAVGHETDTSIADLVADIRAPTPSAAAEIAIAEKKELFKTLKIFQNHSLQIIIGATSKRKKLLQTIVKSPHFSSPYHLIGRPIQQLDEFKNTLDKLALFFMNKKRYQIESLLKQLNSLKPSAKLGMQKKRLEDLQKRFHTLLLTKQTLLKQSFNAATLKEMLEKNLKKELATRKERLMKLVAHLKSVNPKSLLKKGYSILFSENDKSVILSIEELKVNQKFYALVSDGKIAAKVEEIKS